MQPQPCTGVLNHVQQSKTLAIRPFSRWAFLQAVFWVLGVGIVLSLWLRPTLGLHLLWDGLIPLAPLLLVVVPGLWRNVCPVSTMGMLPHRLGFSQQRAMSASQRLQFQWGGLALLFVLVPLRHALLDTQALASAVFLLLAAGFAFFLGRKWAWKSAWCAGLCPLRPVESLYGFRPAATFANAHCGSCGLCSTPCPDATFHASRPGLVPGGLQPGPRKWITGSFVGFIWGWFQVRDYVAFPLGEEAWAIYAWPWGGAVMSYGLLLLCERLLPKPVHPKLYRFWACAAVCCYYSYRLPALFGFGLYPGDGMLIDLSPYLPSWVVFLGVAALCSFLVWWMLLRIASPAAWMRRPPYALQVTATPNASK